MMCEQSRPDQLVRDVQVAFVDAGFDEVAVVQIGGEAQEQFCRWSERELLPALHAL